MLKLSVLILFCSSSLLWAQEAKQIEKEADREFRSNLKDLNERYEDFFVHHQEKSRQKYEREIAAQDQTDRRQALVNAREEARRAYKRPKKSVRDEKEHLIKKESLRKDKEKAKSAYIQRRDRLEKIRNSARKIPQRQDVGLDSVGSAD